MTKNITKRTIAGVLSVLCAAGIVTANVSLGGAAADTAIVASAVEISGDYQYNVLDDGTAKITKYSGSDEVLEIPAEIDGYVVTSIGYEAFSSCTSLESVTIPDSVTSIGMGSFEGCNSLTLFTIPNSVAFINWGAFWICNNLKDVYYSGTESQWNAIRIGDSNDSIKNATIHFESKNIQNPTVTFEKGNGAVKLKCNKVDGAEKYGVAGYIGGKWGTSNIKNRVVTITIE